MPPSEGSIIGNTAGSPNGMHGSRAIAGRLTGPLPADHEARSYRSAQDCQAYPANDRRCG